MYEVAPTALSRAWIAVSKRLLAELAASPRLCATLGKKRAAPIDGRALDPVVGAMLSLDDVLGGSDMTGRTPQQARAKMAEQLAIGEKPPESGIRVDESHLDGPGGRLGVRRYCPEELSGVLPTLVYFHGGGYVIGGLGTHDGICRRIAKGGRCRVVAIEYRLAPEDPFPAAIDDGIAGFRWFAERADDFGIDSARMAVGGDSAGGNLSAVVSLRTRGDRIRPALQVLIYPATDATRSLPSHTSMGTGFLLSAEVIDWYYDHYLAGDRELRRHPDVSPLLSPDVSNAPPALIYTAAFDPLRDEGEAYGKRLEESGVPVELHEIAGLPHGFLQLTRGVASADRAVDEIASRIGQRLRSV